MGGMGEGRRGVTWDVQVQGAGGEWGWGTQTLHGVAEVGDVAQRGAT